MTRRLGLTLAAAAVVAAGAAGAAYRFGWPGFGADPVPEVSSPGGAEPDSWSATVVRTFTIDGREQTETTRVARQGLLSRLEWTEHGGRMALILRPDLGVAWRIDLDRNIYVSSETEPGSAGPPASPGRPPAGEPLSGQAVEAAVGAGQPAGGTGARRERTGEETVDGHRCTVYRTRIEALDGSVGESTVWEAADLGGLAIRSETRGPNGNVVRTQLLQIERHPAPSTFELPPGCAPAGQTP